MHNFNVVVVGCSYNLFWLLQSNHPLTIRKVISFYISGMQPDDGYPEVTEIRSCSLQLLH